MSTTITVGYDRRHWVEFGVVDATLEETAILDDIESDAAVKLAEKLELEGRLVVLEDRVDSVPDYFVEYADAVVIDCQTDIEWSRA